jgi:hypothetical protein
MTASLIYKICAFKVLDDYIYDNTLGFRKCFITALYAVFAFLDDMFFFAYGRSQMIRIIRYASKLL